MKRVGVYAGNAVSWMLLLATIGLVALWICSPWRWLELSLVTEHPLSESITGTATEAQGSLIRSSELTFGPSVISYEVVEVFRIFGKGSAPRRMAPGEWKLRHRFADGSEYAERSIEKDPPDRAVRPSYYTQGNVPLGDIAYWKAVAILGVFPAFWFALRYTQRRAIRVRLAEGRCTRCGYDLRGTPDRCPECGKDVSRSNPRMP